MQAALTRQIQTLKDERNRAVAELQEAAKRAAVEVPASPKPSNDRQLNSLRKENEELREALHATEDMAKTIAELSRRNETLKLQLDETQELLEETRNGSPRCCDALIGVFFSVAASMRQYMEESLLERSMTEAQDFDVAVVCALVCYV
jgi:hypothetical protein